MTTDYTKLTKAQLIEEIKLRDSALMSLKHDINAPLIQELEIRQIELEMQNQELRQSQLLLNESRDRYANLHHFAPVGYLTLDENGCVLEINLAGAAMLQQDTARIVGKPFNNYLPPGSSDAFYRHLRRVFGPAGNDVVELKIRRAGNGLVVQTDYLATPFMLVMI